MGKCSVEMVDVVSETHSPFETYNAVLNVGHAGNCSVKLLSTCRFMTSLILKFFVWQNVQPLTYPSESI